MKREACLKRKKRPAHSHRPAKAIVTRSEGWAVIKPMYVANRSTGVVERRHGEDKRRPSKQYRLSAVKMRRGVRRRRVKAGKNGTIWA